MKSKIFFPMILVTLFLGHLHGQEAKNVRFLGKENENLLTLKILEQDDQKANEKVVDESEQPVTSPFWIGVQCEPAENFELTTKATGEITVVGGLRVNAVFGDSPASGAGVEVGDILYKGDGETITDISKLLELTTRKGESAIEFKVVREGEMRALKITPVKRPNVTTGVTLDNSFLLANNLIGIQEVVQIPKDYKITVTLVSGKSPEMVATKGNSVWVIENGKLSKLPEDLQETGGFLVTRLAPFNVDTRQAWQQAQILNQYNSVASSHDIALVYMDQLNHQLRLQDDAGGNQLEKRVEQLQKEVADLKAILIESLKDADPKGK